MHHPGSGSRRIARDKPLLFTENMSMPRDVENITDRTCHDYHGIPSNPRDVRRYDRVVGLSLRWRM